jgi:hypothetical protein
VHDISGSQDNLGDDFGGRRFVDAKRYMAMAGMFRLLGVFVYENLVGFQFPEGGIPGLQICDLFVGPLKPAVHRGQVRAHDLPLEDDAEEVRPAERRDATDAAQRGRTSDDPGPDPQGGAR